jgi:hypothetical protein
MAVGSPLYISRKLARKCHKNSGKKREGWEGEGRRVRGRSIEALPVLRFIVSIDSLLFFRFVVLKMSYL